MVHHPVRGTVARLMVASLAAAAVSVTLSSSPASAVDMPPVLITGYAVNGTGCPATTVAAAISPDQEAITVIYSQYMAEITTLSSTKTRNCVLTLNLDMPAGFTAAIVGIDHYGFKIMAPTTNATLYTEYRWSGLVGGTVPGQSYSITIPGGTDNWARHDTVTAMWLPCDQDPNFVVSTRLAIPTGQVGDMITMDSQDADFSTIFHLDWRSCAIL